METTQTAPARRGIGAAHGAAAACAAQKSCSWAEKWIGVRDADCAAFAERVLREEFGATVPLPSRADSRRALDAQVADRLAASLRPAAEPRDGDVCLMRGLGRRAGVGAHVGVRADIGGEAHVLHQRTGGCGELHTAAALFRCGLEIEGWWTWR